MIIINNIAEWNPLTIDNILIRQLVFLNVSDTIYIDRVPPNIKIITLDNSPNIQFTGNSTNYSSVDFLSIAQDVAIVDWPCTIISTIQASSLHLRYSGNGNAIRTSLKSNLSISYPLRHITLSHLNLAADSLDNILSFTSLRLSSIHNSIIPRLSSNIESLHLMGCGTIIFTGYLPIRLKEISLRSCEINKVAAATI
jgi:hypothetical protein